MDTHYGKYQGPLAALTERWILGGERGDLEFSNSDIGEGTALFKGPFTLAYSEAKYLRDEFECSDEELDILEQELDLAQGVMHSWDSQGFIYGWPLRTIAMLHEAIAAIERDNAEFEDLDPYRDETK